VLLKKNILLPIYNSNDVVMSRENRNFHLCLFVKGKALQLGSDFLLLGICTESSLNFEKHISETKTLK
jgi:hypothetical protein